MCSPTTLVQSPLTQKLNEQPDNVYEYGGIETSRDHDNPTDKHTNKQQRATHRSVCMICQVNKSKGDTNETTSEPKLDVIYPKPRKMGIFKKSTKLEVTEDDETKKSEVYIDTEQLCYFDLTRILETNRTF